MAENDNKNEEKKDRRKDQKEVKRFMKEFFKTEIDPDTWECEIQLGAFTVDGYNEELDIVWEYDGPYHYTNEKRIEKDKERDKYLSKNYKFIWILSLIKNFKSFVLCL